MEEVEKTIDKDNEVKKDVTSVPNTVPEEPVDVDEEMGLYSKEEKDILTKNQRIRDLIIDTMTSNGQKPPDNIKDYRILKEFLESSDSSVHSSAQNRAKHDVANSKEQEANLVASLIRELNANRASTTINNIENRTVVLKEDQFPELQTVPGEDSLEQAEITLEEILSKD